MVNRNVYIIPANESGSFCDAQSGNHYDNLSRDEAIETQEAAMRRGDTVSAEYEPSDYSPDQRWNALQVDIDAVGSERPSKAEPGR